ncbi:MAG: dihydropteroate synthase, partial [Chloroflexi bacterium]|nr:dihydropteroate synthase [Chloroflexota bacterium]
MKIGATEFSWGKRTYVMGVVNVTPDSFSGDGTLRDAGSSDRWVQAAVEQALRMEDDGADVIDVGGESTRPPSMYAGAEPVDADAECSRVLPVIEALKERLSVPISIDTRKAAVARAAVSAGVALINDISMLGDAEMAATAAWADVPIVISHIRAKARYTDPAREVAEDLEVAIAHAVAAGVSRDRVIADPGIGFGKTARHSLAVLRGLSSIKKRLGVPMLVGTSRKSFIGAVLNLPVDERLEGTAATMALAVAAGANMVRVHDVKEMARVVKMADAVVRGWES